MSTLDRYLAKEVLLPFAAGVLFLTQILLATQILAQAHVLFGSGVSLLDVGSMVLFLLPNFLGYVVPIAFLLGCVVGFGRLADDREIVALAAAGIAPWRLVPVPVTIAAALAALGLWNAVQIEPSSLSAARRQLTEIVKKNVRNDIHPGTFYDQIPGFTLYAERVRGGRWENVLVSDRSDPSAPVLALGREGRLDPVGGGEEMALGLEGGEIHRDSADEGEYVVALFRRAEMVLGIGTVLSDRGGLVRANRDSVEALAASARAARAAGRGAEADRLEAVLHRKIASPLAVIPFAFLAVPLGATRRGRAYGVAAAFAAVVAHYLLLRVGQVLAQRGALPAAFALELPTIVLSAAGLALTAQQARRGPGARR